jgi:XTP/dITP diphosphohydrolase
VILKQKFRPLPMTPAPPLPRLIVATRNRHKTAEIRSLIGPRFEVLDATDFPDFPEVEETGTTFLENATLKAVAISRLVAGWVMADDSGLEVDALGGAPGVWSSSFGGEEGNHDRNNARLAAAMQGQTVRSARFRCTIVLARTGVAEADFCGVVEGAITAAAAGAGGFGYDPLFVPTGYDRTFAELGESVKNAVSHRARALAQAVEWLDQLKEEHTPNRP